MDLSKMKGMERAFHLYAQQVNYYFSPSHRHVSLSMVDRMTEEAVQNSDGDVSELGKAAADLKTALTIVGTQAKGGGKTRLNSAMRDFFREVTRLVFLERGLIEEEGSWAEEEEGEETEGGEAYVPGVGTVSLSDLVPGEGEHEG